MRRLLVAGLVACAIGVSVHAAVNLWPNFSAQYYDFVVASSPCGGSATLQATPFVFDQRVWITYLCADTRTVVRRFDTVIEVERIPTGLVCPAGFVVTWDKQGCVPPDHPAAGK